MQKSQEIHREGAGARGAGSWKGRRRRGRMLSLPGDLHFLVVTNTISEDIDLQEKRRQMVRPGRMPHAQLGTGVKEKMLHGSLFPSGPCAGFSTELGCAAQREACCGAKRVPRSWEVTGPPHRPLHQLPHPPAFHSSALSGWPTAAGRVGLILAHLQKGGRCGFAFSGAEARVFVTPCTGGARSFSDAPRSPAAAPSIVQPTPPPRWGAEGAARHTEGEQAHGGPRGSPRISAA